MKKVKEVGGTQEVEEDSYSFQNRIEDRFDEKPMEMKKLKLT